MNLKNIRVDFENNEDKWKQIYDSPEPHLMDFPEPWNKDLSYFQKCIVLRIIRYDKLLPAIQYFISSTYM